jgi:hypothetical protein
MELSVFINLCGNILTKIQLKMALQYRLFLVHIHLLDAAYAIHKEAFSSFPESFHNEKAKIMVKFDAHHLQLILMFSFTEHLAIKLVVGYKCLPLLNSLFFFD